MKKLLFVLAFTFIGQQAFSQMYIVIVNNLHSTHPIYSSCGNLTTNHVMTTIDPLGAITYQCMPYIDDANRNGNNAALLNLEFSSILSQGYKLVFMENGQAGTSTGTWYFAIP